MWARAVQRRVMPALLRYAPPVSKYMIVLVQDSECPRTSRTSSPFAAINVSNEKLARKRDRSEVTRAHLYDRQPIKCYGSPISNCEHHRSSDCDGPNSRGVEKHLRCEQ